VDIFCFKGRLNLGDNQPPRPEKMILIQLIVCSSGHPAFKEEGGEISVVQICFEFQNLY
jgi:hypothetical protein